MTRSPLELRYPLMVANLVRQYRQASPAALAAGRNWYPAARRIVAEWSQAYAIDVQTVANVIAALSPQVEWSRNLIMADDLLAGRPLSIGGAIRSNIAKAYRLLDSGSTMSAVFPSGPKVNCFAANLAGDDGLVTIDVHASQAALCDPCWYGPFSMAKYQVFARAYQAAALRCDETPATFQAVIWSAWKERYPRERKNATKRSRAARRAA